MMYFIDTVFVLLDTSFGGGILLYGPPGTGTYVRTYVRVSCCTVPAYSHLFILAVFAIFYSFQKYFSLIRISIVGPNILGTCIT